VKPEACSNAGKGLSVFSVPLATPELSLSGLVNSNAAGSVPRDDELLLDEEDDHFQVLPALQVMVYFELLLLQKQVPQS
jgi:hypothetical protein